MTQPKSSPVRRGLEGQLHVASGKPHHHHQPRCFICRMGGSLTYQNPPPRPRPSQSPTGVLLPGIARVTRTRASLVRAGLWRTRSPDSPWAGLLYRDLVSGEGRGRGSREAGQVRGSRSRSSARQAQRLCARPAAAILNRVWCGAF